MHTTATCTADSCSMAQDIVSRLQSAGVDDHEITVHFPDKSSTRDFAREMKTRLPAGAARFTLSDSLATSILGIFAGVGLLVLPFAEPIIASQQITAMLSGIGLGAAVGGVAAAIIALGIPFMKPHAAGAATEIAGIQVAVHAMTPTHLKLAEEVFEAAGAADISTASVSS